MVHPILEPIVSQLPSTVLSRMFIEGDRDYNDIVSQLTNERQWLRAPFSTDDKNRTGIWYLEKNGYAEWLKDAEDEDFIRMVGVLQLTLDTFSSLEEDLEEND